MSKTNNKNSGSSAEEKKRNKFLLSQMSFHIRPSLSTVFIILLLIILATGTIAFFMTDYTHFAVPDYKVEDIARKDVIAPQDFEYIDENLTKMKRENAIKATLPVYDYNPTIGKSNAAKVRTAFQLARQYLADIEKLTQDKQALAEDQGGSAALEERIQAKKKAMYDDIAKSLEGKIKKEQFNMFFDQHFSLELENLIVQVYKRVQDQYIINFDDFQTVNGSFKIFNIESKEEKVCKDTNNFLHIKAAYRIPDFDFGDLTYKQAVLLRGFIAEILTYNITFNSNSTKTRQDSAAADISPAVVKVKKGKIIVRRGDEVTEDVVQQLDGLKNLKGSKIKIPVVVGNSFMIVGLLLVLFFYISRAPQIRMTSLKKAIISITVLLLNVLFIEGTLWFFNKMTIGLAAEPFNDIYYYNFGLPYVMGTMLVTLLISSTVALPFSVIFSIIGTLLLDNQINTFIYIFIGSIIAIYTIEYFKERSGIVKAGFIVGAISGVSFIILEMISKGSFEAMDIRCILFGSFMGLFGGVLTSVFVVTFMPLFEVMFQVTTDIRLLELSSMDVPILRTLAEKAPGTYHHSLVVGTLAESAAKAIRANHLLTRVACYYHDIGKTVHPHFFIENQRGFNIHDHFNPEQSAEKIISHVDLGVKLAKQMKLPTTIQDVIKEHHGTKYIHYFLEKAKEMNKDNSEEIDKKKFRYHGPKPRTTESAIIMLADVVEAASRTIKEPTHGKLRAMIHKLIDDLIKDGQFSNCKITIADIEAVSASFLTVLSAQLHHRIQYQGLDFDKISKKDEETRPAVINL